MAVFVGVCLVTPAAAAGGRLTETPGAIRPAEPDKTALELEKEFHGEQERLKKLKAELEVIDNAPLPANAPHSAGKKGVLGSAPRMPKVSDIPAKAAPGAEEQLADMLYQLGEYKKACAIYESIAKGQVSKDRVAWAMLQVGNCARRMGNHLRAVKAYENLMNTLPEHPWAAEAKWWADQVRWWVLWNESRRKQPQAAGLAPGQS